MSAAPARDERLGARYIVDGETVEEFWRDGYVRFDGVLDAAVVAEDEPLITGKVIELNTMHLPLAERSTYDKAFLQVTNLARESSDVERFVGGARLAGIAAELLRVPHVRLYSDQALYKEPSGGVTPWHADQYYWPLSSSLAITAWVPLQDTPSEMGPLEFARGSHELDIGRSMAISAESEASVAAELERHRLDVDQAPYALGDVSFHLGWTFHHAGPNRSGEARRVMTIIYVDADIRATEPRTPEHQAAYDITFPGVQPGELLDTTVNPILPTPT